MTAIHFFTLRSRQIAETCTVVPYGQGFILRSVWRQTEARCHVSSLADRRAIRRILADAGAVIVEMIEEEE